MTDPGNADDAPFPPQTSEAAVALVGTQFDKLTGLADRFDDHADAVSGWSVGRHAFHLALAGSNMAVALLSGRQWDGEPSAPGLKEHVLKTGTIPLGRAEAPEPVRPAPDPAKTDVLSALSKGRTRIERIMSAPADAYMIHPYLGRLSRDELLRFIAIHNRHHLHIIDRILTAG